MSYSPSTDFLALLRQTSGGVRTERMPGLDYLISGLMRAGVFLLSTRATAPTEHRDTTVWLRPASPSWAAEGAVFLFNAGTQEYEPATPELWAALFTFSTPSSVVFQSVVGDAADVSRTTTILAIERDDPNVTVLTLPLVSDVPNSRPLRIVDWSSNIMNHQITLQPGGTDTVMRVGVFKLWSTADQRAGVTLQPSTELNGWVIAP